MKSIIHMLTQWRKANDLLYVTFVRPKKGRQNFYGRIISFDPILETILFYCDDQSSTHLLSFTDIDNIEPVKFVR